MAAEKVNIFNIDRFSYHDGPGIRTVIYMKGCSMRCSWCHNPESQDTDRNIMYFADQCISCKKCLDICTQECHQFLSGEHHYDRGKCRSCGNCAEVCYSGALKIAGNWDTIKNVLRETLADKKIYDISGGGVTLSGGEPLMQEKACLLLLKHLKSHNINTAVQTAGNVPWNSLKSILPYTDYLFYDLKAIDNDKHIHICGVQNKKIIQNLIRLKSETVNLTIRIPVAAEVNDSKEELLQIIKLVALHPFLRGIELLPLHHLSKGKYVALDRTYRAKKYVAPDEKHLESLKSIIISSGIRAI